MKDSFDDEVLNFSYILIRRIPTRGRAKVDTVARIESSKESVAIIEALRRCKYTTRRRIRQGGGQNVVLF